MALTNPTITGWSGFWQMTGGPAAVSAGPYDMIANKNGQKGRSEREAYIARLFARNQFRDQAAVLGALIGAAAGSNATSTYKREQAPAGPSASTPVVTSITDLGGAINIETVTVINRNTTAADVTYLKDYWDGDLLERTISYPTVLGSGGGGRQVNGQNFF